MWNFTKFVNFENLWILPNFLEVSSMTAFRHRVLKKVRKYSKSWKTREKFTNARFWNIGKISNIYQWQTPFLFKKPNRNSKSAERRIEMRTWLMVRYGDWFVVRNGTLAPCSQLYHAMLIESTKSRIYLTLSKIMMNEKFSIISSKQECKDYAQNYQIFSQTHLSDDFIMKSY